MTVKAIKLKKLAPFQPEKEREVKGLIISVSLFAAGMIIGAGILRSNLNSTGLIVDIFDKYISQRLENNLFQIFINSVIINFVCIIIAGFSGLSCVGLPIAVCLPLIKGLGIGILGGYLFSQFAMSGIGYYLLTVFPGAIISNSALIIICNNACFLSADILAIILAKKPPVESEIKLYIKNIFIILLISLAASILDCLLTKAFSYLFIF